MYGRILVPVDGSATSLRGLQEAIGLARSEGSQLCLYHIVNELVLDASHSSGWYSDTLVESLRKNGEEILAATAAVAKKQGLEPECILEESIGGMAGALIAEQARKCKADLIVMGTHGRRGVRRLTLGSDAEEVLRLSPVPVLLVRAPRPS